MKSKPKLWTNSDLRKEFDRLKKLYFDETMPNPRTIRFEPIDGLGRTFRYRNPGKRRSKDDDFGIQISRKLRYSRRLWLGTLVHEMVHLEQRNKYSCGIRGKRFNGRMRQLALTGCFDGIW